MSERRLPLDGIRVIDASRVLAGPFATMLLADLGADVVKLEPPGGDESRDWGPPWWGDPADRRSAYYAAVNRNKRSACIDLRTEAGRDVLDRLASRADLLFHNHRPMTAQRLGLDERMRSRHPRLTVVAVGGLPGDAAARERPAYDLLAQAVSGWMAVTGEPGRPPVRIGVALLDLVAGMQAAIGALAALVARGEGEAPRHVEVSLVEAAVASLINVLGNLLASGAEPARHGSAHPNIVPYQAFAARDGELVLAVGNDAQFRSLMAVLGLDDPEGRYATNARRLERRAELVERLASSIAARGRDELLAHLDAVDVPAGPVRSVGEAVEAMEAAHGGRWLEEADGIRVPPSTFRLDGDRASLRRHPPRLGEHTAAVLEEAGFDDRAVRALYRAGVVR